MTTLGSTSEVGIYVPDLDAVTVTAVHNGTPITGVIKRLALMMLGCRPMDDPATLLSTFEKHRMVFERAAAENFPRA
jgi:hypothetical protein